MLMRSELVFWRISVLLNSMVSLLKSAAFIELCLCKLLVHKCMLLFIDVNEG